MLFFSYTKTSQPATTTEATSQQSKLGDQKSHRLSAKMMHMTFYWGTKVTILFDSWKTDSWISYGLALVACFIFSIFYQYMEDRRIRFKILSVSEKSQASAEVIAAPLLYSKPGGGKWAPARFVEAILFGINSAIGYLLMLAIMSFNAGVFLAVVVGLGAGYLLFRGGDESVNDGVENPCACA